MSNYCFQDPDIKDGSVITSGNFSQLYPNTEIMKDISLTINGGNWTNVKKQSTWTINGGNWTQVNRCSNLHPGLVSKGLTECAENCEHVVNAEEIYIDDILADTIYTYEDIVS